MPSAWRASTPNSIWRRCPRGGATLRCDPPLGATGLGRVRTGKRLPAGSRDSRRRRAAAGRGPRTVAARGGGSAHRGDRASRRCARAARRVAGRVGVCGLRRRRARLGCGGRDVVGRRRLPTRSSKGSRSPPTRRGQRPRVVFVAGGSVEALRAACRLPAMNWIAWLAARPPSEDGRRRRARTAGRGGRGSAGAGDEPGNRAGRGARRAATHAEPGVAARAANSNCGACRARSSTPKYWRACPGCSRRVPRGRAVSPPVVPTPADTGRPEVRLFTRHGARGPPGSVRAAHARHPGRPRCGGGRRGGRWRPRRGTGGGSGRRLAALHHARSCRRRPPGEGRGLALGVG